MKIWEAGKVENSVTSPYEIDKITGSGYKCSECKNSKNFDGEFHLYRLYYKEDEVWDFDYEIDVPIHIECSKCASEKIIIEYKKGLAFKYDNGVKTDNNQMIQEFIAPTDVTREDGYLYYVDEDGNVGRSSMGSGKELIAKTGVSKESGYLYYVKCSECRDEPKCIDPASHTIGVWRVLMVDPRGDDFNEILPNCLVLVSGNRLINFENSDGFEKLFKQLGCDEKVCLKAKKMINEMVDWEFNQAPFIDIENNVDNVISKIIVKNGMEQNSDGIDGIFDGGGTYKEFYVSKGF